MLSLGYHENDTRTASLHLDARAIGRLCALDPDIIDITPRLAPERAKVEAFIAQTYARAYGANIEVAYPSLMSVRDSAGNILAAAGFRYASQEPLFLEQYTEWPIEMLLSARLRRDVARKGIVEIGNLASAGNGASILLFAALASYFDSQGIGHAVITGTAPLRTRLQKMGLAPVVLCEADPSLLSDAERENWGRYYETRPHVLAGSIADGVSHLKKAMGAVYERASSLSTRLHLGGRA